MTNAENIGAPAAKAVKKAAGKKGLADWSDLGYNAVRSAGKVR